ncbi:MAG TPA: acetyl-CoA carboxylase, carboxyltransferase subunit beta [Thermomicrobiales bacterium]|mgnify:CR=1 FL=1|jgi:acetyl-CoA carboxylase carboxyl transferase subunit beta|nr:acetyl-CoA carboxylase carboxyl transferase subunit beta [Chloroflexota bacterium]HQX62440.1 acetyl-CoA carboxylase, carboxyltransferase subunit beta [Thermomicrobiales bacterium]HBY46039.1 acetyl-CoA carboxylase carboxyl transferase subunit beta [Chloroflexota bacterium]HCG29420.1 acetyl-CoA carboxylase carboxyl transferase subunit beta [Chloroflexota bacterium]HQZ91018.1 acetyl-CoA carboxylase, carboxyltransferase subunit beta [Thermomicrobiales bacterium]
MRELFRRQPRFTTSDDEDARSKVPEDLWVKCPKCGELAYTKEHLQTHRVCQRCGYHFRLAARERIDLLADEGSFVEWDTDLTTDDPLGFSVDGESYADKARKTAAKSGMAEAVISGEIAVDGQLLAIVVTDFSFMGASMGAVYGEKLARAAERAVAGCTPLLTISASGGARMQEGLFSLMQMAKTTAALTRLTEQRLPHIALLTDPCYGGVTASYATVADMIVAEPGALIGFAGPRVIEQTIRQKLPEGFQTAEFLLEHGLIDRVVPRSALKPMIGSLMRIYQQAAGCLVPPAILASEVADA